MRIFGPFQLDPQTGELRRNGYRIRLQPQPTRILLLFTEAPGKLVTRQEIRQQVWGDDTFVDFDQSLNFAIHQVRLALNDSADIPNYIETIPKRGYRFIADVQQLPQPEPPRQEQRLPVPPPMQETSFATETVSESFLTSHPEIHAEFTETTHPRRRSTDYPFIISTRQWIYVAATIAICLIGAFAFFALSPQPQTKAIPETNISIAVLPFTNLMGDPVKDYISDGFTDEIIARIAKLDPMHLRVTARTSAMSYKGDREALQRIANDLGVHYIVQGSIQLENDHMRVIAHLVKVQDLREVWSSAFDGEPTQVFHLESMVAESIVHALPLGLPLGPLSEHDHPNYQANNQYLKGLDFLSQRSKSGFEAAVQSFSNAIQANPTYSVAYAELANTYNLMGQYNWITTGEAHSLGKAAALQALAIDPSLSGAHSALGFSKWFYEWDIPGGEKEFLHAIDLNPNNVNAHHWYATLLMTAGRFPEAEQQMRLAQQLDPRALILRTNMGWIHYTERNYALAASELQSVLNGHPDFLTAHYKLWYAYSVKGDTANAWLEFDAILRSIANPQHRKIIVDEYRQHGYSGAMLRAAVTDDPAYVGSTVDRARCMIFAGRTQDALQKLTSAYDEHEGWMIFVATDPAFDQLRPNPGFQQLLTKIRAASTSRG